VNLNKNKNWVLLSFTVTNNMDDMRDTEKTSRDQTKQFQCFPGLAPLSLSSKWFSPVQCEGMQGHWRTQKGRTLVKNSRRKSEWTNQFIRPGKEDIIISQYYCNEIL